MVMKSTLYQGNIKLPLFLQSHHWKIEQFSGIQSESGSNIEKRYTIYQQTMLPDGTVQNLLIPT